MFKYNYHYLMIHNKIKMCGIKNIKRITILIVVLFIVNLCQAQDNTGCFTKFQLIKMQKTSLSNVRTFLNHEGWSFKVAQSNQTFNYFDYTFNYNIVQWEKSSYNGGNLILYNLTGKPNIVIFQAHSACFQELMNGFSSNLTGTTKVEDNILSTTFIEGGVTIEFREYRQDNSSRQYSILVYNSIALQQEIKNERDKEEALIKAEKEAEFKYQNIVMEADRLFNLKKYEEAKIQYNFANELQYNIEILNKIDACNEAICNKIISNANNQFEAGNYATSITTYEQAIGCAQNVTLIQNKIALAKKKINEIKINEKLNLANSYFLLNDLELALKEYNEVLILDEQNYVAIGGINKINTIKDILKKRKTTIFSYAKTNPIDFSSLNDRLLNNLNSVIATKKNGFLNCEFKIAFDTLGRNSSALKLNSSSDSKYLDFLNEASNLNSLNSSKISGYFISSTDLINIDLKWQTDNVHFKSNFSGIKTVNHSYNNNAITKYINSQNYKYGKFTFEVKSKTFNNNILTDIKLVNYKSTTGPSSVIYSILMPGMGTLKVTNGKKGWGRFAVFLVSSGVAIGSRMYSDIQYKNYLQTSDQLLINKYYNIANNSHKTSLILSGLSATIYLYDVIWVFSKGIKNKKEAKYLRKQLNLGPIEIQKQLISIQ